MRFDTRVPRDYALKDQDLFFISADFVGALALAAAPAATATQSIVITADADAHLLLVGSAFTCTTTAETADAASAFILATLKMSSSGREMMNNAQHLRNISGTAQLPCVWPRPKFLAATSSMKVTLQNQEGTARAVRMGFYCFKIFV